MRRPFVYLLVIAIGLGVGYVTWNSWRSVPTAGAPGQEGYVSTQWGPLGPADRDLIVRVRLAGLWEHPIGQEMAERGSQKRVREVGELISVEHLQLDEMVVATAKDLGVLLPNQPTAEQQSWMEQTTQASGASYDWMAVNILRQAHGSIFATAAAVRASTRNEKVRTLADQGLAFVARHMGYLESTGLVDFDRLDEAPQPPRAVVTRAGQYENVPVALLALASLVLLAVPAVVIVRMLTQRRRRRSLITAPPPVQAYEETNTSPIRDVDGTRPIATHRR